MSKRWWTVDQTLSALIVRKILVFHDEKSQKVYLQRDPMLYCSLLLSKVTKVSFLQSYVNHCYFCRHNFLRRAEVSFCFWIGKNLQKTLSSFISTSFRGFFPKTSFQHMKECAFASWKCNMQAKVNI